MECLDRRKTKELFMNLEKELVGLIVIMAIQRNNQIIDLDLSYQIPYLCCIFVI